MIPRKQNPAYGLSPLPLLLNPSAGQGRALRQLPAIRKAFSRSGQPLDLHLSSNPEDFLAHITRAHDQDTPDLALAGGDGTFSMALDHWLTLAPVKPPPRLFLLGCGSANDLPRSLGTWPAPKGAALWPQRRETPFHPLLVEGDDGRPPHLLIGTLSWGIPLAVNSGISTFMVRHPWLQSALPLLQSFLGLHLIHRSLASRNRIRGLCTDHAGQSVPLPEGSLLVLSLLGHYSRGKRIFPEKLPAEPFLLGMDPPGLTGLIRASKQVPHPGTEGSFWQRTPCPQPPFTLSLDRPHRVLLDGEIKGPWSRLTVRPAPWTVSLWTVPSAP